MVKEEVLHWVWKFQLLSKPFCYSSKGDKIQIVNVGKYNESNSGPDFSAARIIINDILWVGNIEIHVRTSDWFYHGHQFDKSYENVILHVVYEDDTSSVRAHNDIPILELRKWIEPELWGTIELLQKSKESLPCSTLLEEISDLEWISWQDRLLVERFEKKVKEVDFI